jgi:hypothetical protein
MGGLPIPASLKDCPAVRRRAAGGVVGHGLDAERLGGRQPHHRDAPCLVSAPCRLTPRPCAPPTAHEGTLLFSGALAHLQAWLVISLEQMM